MDVGEALHEVVHWGKGGSRGGAGRDRRGGLCRRGGGRGGGGRRPRGEGGSGRRRPAGAQEQAGEQDGEEHLGQGLLHGNPFGGCLDCLGAGWVARGGLRSGVWFVVLEESQGFEVQFGFVLGIARFGIHGHHPQAALVHQLGDLVWPGQGLEGLLRHALQDQRLGRLDLLEALLHLAEEILGALVRDAELGRDDFVGFGSGHGWDYTQRGPNLSHETNADLSGIPTFCGTRTGADERGKKDYLACTLHALLEICPCEGSCGGFMPSQGWLEKSVGKTADFVVYFSYHMRGYSIMPRQLSEERTRKEMIDPQLERAGWYLRDHSRVKIEIPVDGYDAEPWNGVTDYTLYRENGEVLAVVEAKRTSTDVRLAEAQLTHYVTEIEKHQSFRPFGFLANGLEIHFVDVGHASKREVFGFFTREDLENLLYLRYF